MRFQPVRPLPEWVPRTAPPDWELRPPPPPTGWASQARLWVGLGILGLLWAMLLFDALRRPPPTNTEVPEELLGVWTTSEANYADRFLQFEKDAVILGVGSEVVALYRIVNIEKAVLGYQQTLYTFHYATAEEQNKLIFVYNAQHVSIRFQNQPNMLWRKQAE